MNKEMAVSILAALQGAARWASHTWGGLSPYAIETLAARLAGGGNLDDFEQALIAACKAELAEGPCGWGICGPDVAAYRHHHCGTAEAVLAVSIGRGITAAYNTYEDEWTLTARSLGGVDRLKVRAKWPTGSEYRASAETVYGAFRPRDAARLAALSHAMFGADSRMGDSIECALGELVVSAAPGDYDDAWNLLRSMTGDGDVKYPLSAGHALANPITDPEAEVARLHDCWAAALEACADQQSVRMEELAGEASRLGFALALSPTYPDIAE